MAAPPDSVSAPQNIPFLNIVDPEFDFASPEVISAQAESWYAVTPVGLLVLRYAEAQELLRDRRLDHNGKRFMEMNGVTGGPLYDWFVPMIVNQDGAAHRRLRGLVNKAFTPRMIENVRPFIRAAAERLAGQLAAAGAGEFMDDFADPLPLAVMCHVLGVPAEDYDMFRAWTTDIGLVFSMAYGGDARSRVENAVVGLSGYVDALMKAKKAQPTDDLISVLVTLREAEGQVSTEELRNLLVTLVFGAHDNTRNQFGNVMVTFAGHPGQWALLAQQPGLMPQAVEELMRWCPSAMTLFRFAAGDFDYQGLRIAADTQLTMCILGAQRDPRVFRNGNSFDITVTREAPALQFGGGPHHCLGAALARAELGEALHVLTSRLAAPSLAGPVAWRRPLGIYGPEKLPLRFG